MVTRVYVRLGGPGPSIEVNDLFNQHFPWPCPVNMPIWGPHGFLVGNWATGLCVGQFTGAQVGLAWA